MKAVIPKYKLNEGI